MTAKTKLTKTFVDSLPLCEKGQTFYRDSELQGFALRVTKVKSYIVERKSIDGKTCRVTIGKHGQWTVVQAREKAREYLHQIANGIDPNSVKQSNINQIKLQSQIPTLLDAWNFYKSRKQLSSATILAYNNCVTDYFSDWQNLKLNQITKRMVIDRHYELSQRSPAQANLAAKFLRALINYLIAHYLDDSGNRILHIENPVEIIKEQRALNKIKRRRGHIRSDQHLSWATAVLKHVWRDEQGDNHRNNTNRDYLLLLALTGFRRVEGERLPWSGVDLEYGAITITDTKNGEDLLLPMGKVLWQIMRQRHATCGHLNYVFPDRVGTSHIKDRRDIRAKITAEIGIPFTFHDLRRTFGTVANSLAIGSYTIKRLINHTIDDDGNDVTDGYVQVSFDDLRKAMQMIEDVIVPDAVRHLI